MNHDDEMQFSPWTYRIVLACAVAAVAIVWVGR